MKTPVPTSNGPKHNWPPNPYPGLRPFLISEESDESLIFFGRKEQIHDLLDRLGNTHFMAVLGPSGCGKSSLVKAGLIPALDSGLIYQAGANWISAEAEPGSAPINNLAKAIENALSRAQRDDAGHKVPTAEVLAERMHASTTALVDLAEELPDLLEDNTNLLILVDQFEEIFREDLAQRDEDAQLINLLLNVFNMRPEGLYVVMTMRTDYLEQCATFHGLPEALNQSQYLTPRLNPQQLLDSISGPAELRHYGGKVEPKLARKILSEMTSSSGYDPDLLPLMQHALFWMWRKAQDVERAEGEPVLLTLELYQELAGDGGLQGVLSRRADDIFENSLSAEQQSIAECMFRLMSEVDDGARRRRRVTTPEEVAEIADVSLQEAREVIDVFASGTVSFIRWKDDGTTLDITHESLIRKWKKFDAWALEERSDAEEYRDLERATGKWAEDNRATLTEAGLLRWEEFQKRKGNVKRWAARYGDGFEDVSKYLQVSKSRVEEYKARQHDYQQASEREEASRQKMSFLMSAAAVVLVVAAVGFMGWKTSLDKNEVLDEQRQKLADNQKVLEAKSNELQSKTELLENQKEALTKNAEALKDQADLLKAARDNADLARGEAVAEAEQLRESSKRNVRLGELSLQAITLRRAALVEKEVSEGRPATALRLALDIKDIATKADQPFHVALARAATAAPQPGAELMGRFGRVSSVQWREEGGGWTALWQSGAIGTLSTPNALTRPFSITSAQSYVSGGLSPDGRQALVTTQSGEVALLEGGADRQPIKLTLNRGEALQAQYTDDGTVIAVLTQNKSLSVWESETGDLLADLDPVKVDAFDLDGEGTLLATAAYSHQEEETGGATALRIWKLEPNAVFAANVKVPGIVTALRFSPDGSSLAIGLKDGSLKLLTLQGNDIEDLGGQGSAVKALAFSIDATRLGIGGAGGDLRVLSLSGAHAEVLRAKAVSGRDIEKLAFSPDGTTLAASARSIVQVLDAASMSVQMDVRSDERPVALSSDGARVLTVTREGVSWLWDASTGARIAKIQEGPSGSKIVRATFSFDGKHVVSGYQDHSIQISSAQAGEPLRALAGQSGAIKHLASNSDGTRLAVVSGVGSGSDRMVHVRDAQTGKTLISEDLSRSAGYGFSPDGRWFFAMIATDTIRVWNAVTGEVLNDVAVPKARFKKALLFVAKGSSGTSADVKLITLEHRKVRLWDVTKGEVLNRFAPHLRGNFNMSINADASVLMTLSRDEVSLFDLGTRPSPRLLRPMAKARGERLSVGVFDQDGGRNFTLFSASASRRSSGPVAIMTYWATVPLAKARGSARRTAVRLVQQAAVLGAKQFSHEALSWQSPYHLTALTSARGRVQTWQVKRGDRSHALDGSADAIGPLRQPTWADFDADERVVVRSRNGQVVFQKATGDGAQVSSSWQKIQSFASKGRGLIADVSADGKYMVMPSDKSSPIVVEFKNGRQYGVLSPKSGGVNSAVFDATGRKILTTHPDGKARVWTFNPTSRDVKLSGEYSPKKSTQMNLQTGYFDSTGDYFVAATRRGEVSVWSVAHEKPLGTLIPSVPKFVHAVGFSSDDNCIFIETGDGRIQFKSRDNPEEACYSNYTKPDAPTPWFAGYRLLHQTGDREGELLAVSGMSVVGAASERHAVFAIYNRQSGKPVAVWKVPETNFAGWANWSKDGSKLAVPLSNGYVHVLNRPKFATWDALVAYSERAAKPALSKADKERLKLLDVDEVIRLAK